MHVLKLAATSILISSASAWFWEHCRYVMCNLNVQHNSGITTDQLNKPEFRDALIGKMKGLQLANDHGASILSDWISTGDQVDGGYWYTTADFKATHNPTAAAGWPHDGVTVIYDVQDGINVQMRNCEVRGKVSC